MKVTSGQLLDQVIGDSRVVVFHLISDKNYIFTIQNKDAGVVAVVDRHPNGDLKYMPSSGEVKLVSQIAVLNNVTLTEIETLGRNLIDFARNEREKLERQKGAKNKGSK